MAWGGAQLHIQHGRRPAQALRAYAQRVRALEDFEAQRLLGALRAARLQQIDVDRIEQRQLGQQHRLFGRAAYAYAQRARRAPARAHTRQLRNHPVGNAVAGLERREPRLHIAAAALGDDQHFEHIACDDLALHDGGRVVARIAPQSQRVGHHGRAQRIDRVGVAAAHAFVGDFLQAKGRRAVVAIELHAAAQAHEHLAHARVLAKGPPAQSREPAVDQQLLDRGARGRMRLALLRAAQRLHIVSRMVVAHILESPGQAFDQIFLCDADHGRAQSSCIFAAATTSFQRSTSAAVNLPNASGAYCASGSSLMPWLVMRSVQALSPSALR